MDEAGAARPRERERALEQGLSESLTPVLRHHVELLEVRVERPSPERRAKPNHSDPQRAVAGEEDRQLVGSEQLGEAARELLHSWREVLELGVEVVQQTGGVRRVTDVGEHESWLFGVGQRVREPSTGFLQVLPKRLPTT